MYRFPKHPRTRGVLFATSASITCLSVLFVTLVMPAGGGHIAPIRPMMAASYAV